MLDLFNLPTPQGCDIQTFYGSYTGAITSGNVIHKTWNKPRGVSFVYFMLIGSGAQGNGTNTGGGSGAVTVWFGSALNVPDQLVVVVANSGNAAGNANNTFIGSRQISSTTNPTPTALLIASSASSTTAGGAMTANQFCASGFFQSVAGQAGQSGGAVASATTFLSGGSAAGLSVPCVGNYGYEVVSNASVQTTKTGGYFQLQPIIVGVGSPDGGNGNFGCGGGFNSDRGGPGLALIASW